MKKGQTHLSETVAVLFIFFVLILFGIIFYAKFQQGNLEKKQEELLGKKAIETTTKVLFLPELTCTNGEAESEGNCLDMMKVRQSKQLFENEEEYYFELFSYATIKLHQTYPEKNIITLYDRPKPEINLGSEKTFFVLSLKDELLNQVGFGFLEVTVYQ